MISNNKNYICGKCNYSTGILSSMERHIKTTKHKQKEKESIEKINNNNQKFNNELITLKCEIKEANKKNKINEIAINDLKKQIDKLTNLIIVMLKDIIAMQKNLNQLNN